MPRQPSLADQAGAPKPGMLVPACSNLIFDHKMRLDCLAACCFGPGGSKQKAASRSVSGLLARHLRCFGEDRLFRHRLEWHFEDRDISGVAFPRATVFWLILSPCRHQSPEVQGITQSANMRPQGVVEELQIPFTGIFIRKMEPAPQRWVDLLTQTNAHKNSPFKRSQTILRSFWFALQKRVTFERSAGTISFEATFELLFVSQPATHSRQ